VITADEVRRLALTQPEAYEADHHGFPSFRAGGKIFATLPDDEHLHVMVDEDEIRALAAEQPDVYEEKWWGKRLSCVRVNLDRADPTEVAELLADAWLRQAPSGLSAKTAAGSRRPK
jgi:hypothetical protein